MKFGSQIKSISRLEVKKDGGIYFGPYQNALCCQVGKNQTICIQKNLYRKNRMLNGTQKKELVFYFYHMGYKVFREPFCESRSFEPDFEETTKSKQIGKKLSKRLLNGR